MSDPGAGSSSGSYPGPFVPGEAVPQDDPAIPRMAPPFLPGQGEYVPPPDMITDQVAELASHAVELPSISEFLYDEAPVEEAAGDFGYGAEGAQRQTPSRQVPPLPGFTPTRGTPAREFAQQATPASAQRAYEAPAPATESPEFSRTPTAPQPRYRQTPAAPAPAGREGGDWATGEWQRYDWRGAAALAPEERARAAQAWSDLDWESDASGRVRQRNESVAGALEALARRVRAGELPVHGHPGMSEEAAAAAALAALLAIRRS